MHKHNHIRARNLLGGSHLDASPWAAVTAALGLDPSALADEIEAHDRAEAELTSALAADDD